MKQIVPTTLHGMADIHAQNAQAWFAFRAYNSQALYGFGTAEDADRYEDILNEGREINHYAAREMSADEVAEEGLEGRDDTFDLDEEIAAREAGEVTIAYDETTRSKQDEFDEVVAKVVAWNRGEPVSAARCLIIALDLDASKLLVNCYRDNFGEAFAELKFSDGSSVTIGLES